MTRTNRNVSIFAALVALLLGVFAGRATATYPGKGCVCIVRLAGAQNVNSGASTDVIFDTSDYDPTGMWAAGTPTVVTIKEPGVYVAIGTGVFAYNANNDRGTTTVLGGQSKQSVGPHNTDGGSANQLQSSVIYYCNAGDTAKVTLIQDSLASLSVTGSSLIVARIAP